MKRILSRMRLLLCVIASIIVFTNCMTFQSPKTLEPGEIAVGGGPWGITMLEAYKPKPLIEPWVTLYGGVFMRYGILPNLDVGISLGHPYGGLDIKYQILHRGPFFLSADIGAWVTVGVESPLLWFSRASLVFGTERVWGGVSMKYGRPEGFNSLWLAAMIGASFFYGDTFELPGGNTLRIRIMPEIAIDSARWPPGYNDDIYEHLGYYLGQLYYLTLSPGIAIQFAWDTKQRRELLKNE